MKLIDAYKTLKNLKLQIIQTQDVACILKINVTHASKLLARLNKAGQLIHIGRGLWAFPDQLDILLLPQYLTAPFPTYISLQTALYYHDMIMQIPSILYAVSLSRTRLIKTPFQDISIHHIDPSFFFGYEQKTSGVNLATPEKALIDCLYLQPAKSRLFNALPELELPSHFSIKIARQIIKKIPSKSRQTLVSQKFEELILLT